MQSSLPGWQQGHPLLDHMHDDAELGRDDIKLLGSLLAYAHEDRAIVHTDLSPCQSALKMTGALTSPNPNCSGSLKLSTAAATPARCRSRSFVPAESSAAQVGISAGQPVLPRRTEHVHIQCVFQRQRTVG